VRADPARVDHHGQVEDNDFRLLEFEQTHPRNDRHKELSLGEEFSLTPVEYFQRLFSLIDEPDVVSTYPAVRRRLVRLRARQHQVRRPVDEA
jgi:hypothetical protein